MKTISFFKKIYLVLSKLFFASYILMREYALQIILIIFMLFVAIWIRRGFIFYLYIEAITVVPALIFVGSIFCTMLMIVVDRDLRFYLLNDEGDEGARGFSERFTDRYLSK